MDYRGRKLSPQGDLQVAVEQIIMREIAGLAVGVIDGIVGPATLKARSHWEQGNWRNALNMGQFADRRMPKPVRETWPLESEVRAFYGEPGQHLVNVEWPFALTLAWDKSATIRKFKAHEKVAGSLTSIGEEIAKAYPAPRIAELRLDIWGGCFNLRPKVGGKTLSMHSWGIAVDWDPVRNALRMTRTTAQLARPEYSDWWDIWTEHGWLSLGKARDYDWMHVQAARLG